MLSEAYEQVEDEEDEHLYHTRAGAGSSGSTPSALPAELPPPEEEKDVKTAQEPHASSRAGGREGERGEPKGAARSQRARCR